jgi:hypothetical protein
MSAVVPMAPAAPVAAYDAPQTRIWLPLPLSVLWVVLAPFALLLSLFAWVAPSPYRINGPLAAATVGAFLFSLSGTVVEVRNPRADIFILIL